MGTAQICSLAIGNGGSLIAYATQSPNELRSVSRGSSSWGSSQLVEGTLKPGSVRPTMSSCPTADAVFIANGTIFYHRSVTNYVNYWPYSIGHRYIARWNNGQPENVKETYSTLSNVVADSTGSFHFLVHEGNDLMYWKGTKKAGFYWWSSPTWTWSSSKVETVGTDNTSVSCYLNTTKNMSSITLDKNGVPSISYNYFLGVSNPYHKLKYAKFNGTSWSIEETGAYYCYANNSVSLIEDGGELLPQIVYSYPYSSLKFTAKSRTYQSSAQVQSKSVDSTNGAITAATLVANHNTPPKTSIAYYLSANGGVNWEQVTPGVECTFLNPGSDLRWRAVLSTADKYVTPSVQSVTVNYVTRSGCLVSSALDTSSAATSYSSISWNPATQPVGCELKFQLASNNDNSIWNFVGPDGTPNTYYTNPAGQFVWAGHNGCRYLKYKAHLSTNDLSSTPILSDVTVTYNKDPQAPTVAVTHPSNGAQVSGQINVTAQATDNVGIQKVEFYVDGVLRAVTVSQYTYLWDTTLETNNLHTIKAIAYDLAGNTASSEIVVLVNNIAPQAKLLGPTEGSYLKGTTPILGEASDDLGLEKVEIFVDDTLKATTSASSCIYVWDTILEAGGSHVVRLVATDTSGNQTTDTRSVVVDNSVSTTTLTVNPPNPDGANGWYNTAPIISFSSNEEGATYYQIKSGGASVLISVWSTYAGEVIILPDGEHTISYCTIDKAGNVEPVKTYNIKVDTTP